jgi:hypothetical protein
MCTSHDALNGDRILLRASRRRRAGAAVCVPPTYNLANDSWHAAVSRCNARQSHFNVGFNASKYGFPPCCPSLQGWLRATATRVTDRALQHCLWLHQCGAQDHCAARRYLTILRFDHPNRDIYLDRRARRSLRVPLALAVLDCAVPIAVPVAAVAPMAPRSPLAPLPASATDVSASLDCGSFGVLRARQRVGQRARRSLVAHVHAGRHRSDAPTSLDVCARTARVLWMADNVVHQHGATCAPTACACAALRRRRGLCRFPGARVARRNAVWHRVRRHRALAFWCAPQAQRTMAAAARRALAAGRSCALGPNRSSTVLRVRSIAALERHHDRMRPACTASAAAQRRRGRRPTVAFRSSTKSTGRCSQQGASTSRASWRRATFASTSPPTRASSASPT